MDTESNETRSLVISDFRNLGVSALRKNKDERTFLKINRSLKKDELGGLVIILGSNNSGKSNVLDAVAKCTRQDFDDDDVTDFITAAKVPSLTLDIADGKYGEIKPPKIRTGSGNCKIMGTVPNVLLYILRQKESFELFNDWVGEAIDTEAYMNGVEEDIRSMAAGIVSENGKAYAYILRNREGIHGEILDEVANALDDGDIKSKALGRLEITVKGTPINDLVMVGLEKREYGLVPRYVSKDRLEEYNANQGGIKGLAKKAASFLGLKKQYDPLEDVMITDLSGGIKDTDVENDAFSDVYGYNISNNVYKYRPRKLSNKDLTTKVSNPNDFITGVFQLLGYENKSVINAYYTNPNIRDKLEADLNKELDSVSEKLNRLLNAGDKKYKLRIRLESEEIRFIITCGDNIGLNLDHQSEGFRWLFGFFISFLMSKKFVAGDMVIIDEFGGLLNFGTVAELTSILRGLAKRHGITFIMATQNPMSVDITHLDEVRMVVPKPDGTSYIINDFTEFGKGECMDVLGPIVSSMTVGRNFLRSGNRATAFVENYRDYFYLSSFNSVMGYDIDFIPVNGITEFTSEEDYAKVLRSIERHPILLADESIHDEGSIEALKKKGVTVYTVSEITDGSRKSVPELFSESDAARLSVDDASFDRAACLSYLIPSDEALSDETKDNFRKVIDMISLE